MKANTADNIFIGEEMGNADNLLRYHIGPSLKFQDLLH